MKEDRVVIAQITRESKAMDTITRKVPLKKSTLALNQLIKASSLGTIIPKPLTRSILQKKLVPKRVIIVIPPEKVVSEVVVTNRRGRRIKLLS